MTNIDSNFFTVTYQIKILNINNISPPAVKSKITQLINKIHLLLYSKSYIRWIYTTIRYWCFINEYNHRNHHNNKLPYIKWIASHCINNTITSPQLIKYCHNLDHILYNSAVECKEYYYSDDFTASNTDQLQATKTYRLHWSLTTAIH